MKTSTLLSIAFCFLFYIPNSYSQGTGNHLTFSFQNCSQPTPTTIEFDLYVVSDGVSTSDLRMNIINYGVNFDTSICQSGATITPTFTAGTCDFGSPISSFTFPAACCTGHIRINSGGVLHNSGITMTIGTNYRVGHFKLTSSSNWVLNSSPSFALQNGSSAGKNNCQASVYIGTATNPTMISANGTGNNQRSESTSCSLTLNTCTVSDSTIVTNVSCHGGNNGSIIVSASGGFTPYTYLWNTGATTSSISSRTVGIYKVTITDVINCTATATDTITQPSALSISLSSNSPVCSGDTIHLSSSISGGDTAYSYAWTGPGSFSSAIANPNIALAADSSNGMYHLTVTDAHGCTISDSVSVVIPELIIDSVSYSSYIILSISSPSGITGLLWSTGSITDTIHVPSDTTLTYYASATDSNGCTISDSITIYAPPHRIGSPYVDSFSISPNPAIQNIIVSFSHPLPSATTLLITNMLGQTISSFSIAKGELKMEEDISRMVSGVYFVVLQTEDGKTIKKFVKQ